MEVRSRTNTPTESPPGSSNSPTLGMSEIGRDIADVENENSYTYYTSSSCSSEGEILQLSKDLTLLDENQKDAERKMVYKNNKVLFLLQSTLLGISYSMIWPTLWTYISREFNLTGSVEGFIYGLAYVAYPIGSMLSAKLVENLNLSTKSTVLLLNAFEIVGNLIYTFEYFPIFPVLGRFVAGLGDAFYVVLMKEMKSSTGVPDEKMTIECLAGFIVGVVVSPGINIVTTTFLQFNLGSWVLNVNNFPGLTTSVLFLSMQVLILIFLKSNEVSDTSSLNDRVDGSKTSRFIEVTNFIKESPYTIWYVNGYAFIYTYVVAMLELVIPIIMYEKLHSNQREVMILYAVIGTIYAMLLMMTMTVTFDYQPETFFCLSIIFHIAGLFSVLYFAWLGPLHKVWDIVTMAVAVIALTALWSCDDVLFVNFVQTFVPFHQREQTHTARKFTAKLSFAIAGVTVPFIYKQAILVIVPLFVVVVCFMFILFVTMRMFLLKKS